MLQDGFLRFSEGLVVRALYSFQKLQPDDLSFKKGDRLELPDGKM